MHVHVQKIYTLRSAKRNMHFFTRTRKFYINTIMSTHVIYISEYIIKIKT